MSKLSHYNILLVEDEPLLLQSLERHIQNLDMGFKVAGKANNGQEAMDILQHQEVHLIISDIVMPVKSGLELLTYVNHNIPNTEVVLLSGHADFQFAQQSLRDGALEYLLKPITKENLENILIKAKIKLSQYYQLIEDDSLTGATAQQTFENIRLYIRDNYTSQIDLTSLSSKLGVSSAYLTKLFNKFEGCSPIKYLTNLRMTEAKKLLYNTNLTIKEVGEKVGYTNQFYFSRVFRKIYGMSPSEYRNAK